MTAFYKTKTANKTSPYSRVPFQQNNPTCPSSLKDSRYQTRHQRKRKREKTNRWGAGYTTWLGNRCRCALARDTTPFARAPPQPPLRKSNAERPTVIFQIFKFEVLCNEHFTEDFVPVLFFCVVLLCTGLLIFTYIFC